MDIFELSIDSWELILKINCLAVLVLIAIIVLAQYLVKHFQLFSRTRSLELNEVTLGIGNSSVTMSYRQKDKEIAYKLWVELCTRKIGIAFDAEQDVIVEVYNSWYEFFKIARLLLEEIPATRINCSNDLIELTEKILNVGLRPHLTKWQAKFRRWYENAVDKENDPNKTPQEIQREYPQYQELIKDLEKTNKQMIAYKEVMYQIAFDKKI